jgi:hypothetical protein
MPFLTAAQTAQVARQGGEAHKPAEERMVSDDLIDTIAGEVALIVDSEGRTPQDPGYVTTVDIYRVVSEVWKTKAAMAAEDFDFIAEGGEFKRSQVVAHYNAMAAKYAGMARGLTIPTGV